MKKVFCLVLVLLFSLVITGCGSNNSTNGGCTIEDLTKPASQRNCGNTNSNSNSSSTTKKCDGWWEGNRCCNAYPSSYYNYEDPCPGNLVPGSEIPKTVNPNGCYTVRCS